MKTRLLFLLPMVLLLWGCSGDKSLEPDQDCRMQELSYGASFDQEVPSPTQLVRYSYNKEGQLTTMAIDTAGVTWLTYTMSYDSKGRLVQINNSRHAYLNEYNEQDQLVKQRWSYRDRDGVLQEWSYFAFSYNSRSELEEARSFHNDGSQYALIQIWRYTYTNGDPTTIERLSHAGDHEQSVKLTYDDEQRHPQERAYTFFEPLLAPSEHNLLGYVATDNYGRETRYTNTYTYTRQGYPATVINIHDSGLKEHLRYTYSCQ